MMRINPYIQNVLTRPTPSAGPQRESAPQASNHADADTVEVSQAAQEAADEPILTQDIVSRVRAEIEAGTYLTEDKLNATIDRLAEVLTA